MKKLLSVFGFISIIALAGCTAPQEGMMDQLGGKEGESKTETTKETSGGETIKLGYLGPLTGDAASYGQDEKRAIEMFLKKNPEIGGKKVEIIYEDSMCDGLKASTAAQKLINTDKVQLILGGVCSSETLAVAPIADRSKVVLFSSTSTSPDITTAGDFVFRNAPSDEKSTDVLSADIYKSYKKVAILSENTDFAQAYREGLKTKFTALGGEVVFDEPFNPGATDFKTALGKAKDSGAEVIASLTQTPTAAGFINKQMRELDIQLPVYGTDVHTGDEFFEIAGDAAEGTKIVMTSSDDNRAGVKEFFDEYKATYDRDPTIGAYLLLGTDRLNIVKKAIESVGYDGEKIKNWLYTMSAYDGLGGVVEFDENGDSSIAPLMLEAVGGEFVVVQ